MLNLKKSASPVATEELKVANCPICQAYVCHVYFMEDASTKKKSKWFACSCGVVFQSQKPNGVYDQKYYDKTSNIHEKTRTAYRYPVSMYAPIIEELIYGRRVLLLGQNNHYQHEAFEERGWVPTTIDKNSIHKDRHDFIADDFEKHEFTEATKYNLIWIYHTLESLKDPVASLDLCTKILGEDGILFLGAVDTDFINTRSSSCFIHWKPDENYIMWNRRSIIKHLEKLGYNVILARQNYEHRFPTWDDFHIIAQKKFF